MQQDLKLLINTTPLFSRVSLLRNLEIEEIYIESCKYSSLVGNIYIGKIIKVISNINVVFIDIGNNISVFSNIKDNGISYHLGDYVLVQINKDAIGEKSPEASFDIELHSNYFILCPFSKDIFVSPKIVGNEKKRLLDIVSNFFKNLGIKMGGIVRTSSKNIPDDDLREELNYLIKKWNKIKNDYQLSKKIGLLANDNDLISSLLRYMLKEKIYYQSLKESIFTEIYVDNDNMYNYIVDLCKKFFLPLVPYIYLYNDSVPMFRRFRIEQQYENLLNKRVDLPNKSYLIIDENEAMTTIDVNSGNFLLNTSPENAYFQINLDASRYISREIRKRNLSGLIVVDFIDMAQKSNYKKLLSKLKEYLSNDRCCSQVYPLYELGLIHITRKRERDSFFKSLLICGMLKSRENYERTLLYYFNNIVNDIIIYSKNNPHKNVLKVYISSIYKLIINEYNSEISNIQKTLNLTLIIKEDSQLTHYNYYISGE
ncbi:MAG: ribonuclease E/G [Succinivibrionaceae bacterium]